MQSNRRAPGVQYGRTSVASGKYKMRIPARRPSNVKLRRLVYPSSSLNSTTRALAAESAPRSIEYLSNETRLELFVCRSAQGRDDAVCKTNRFARTTNLILATDGCVRRLVTLFLLLEKYRICQRAVESVSKLISASTQANIPLNQQCRLGAKLVTRDANSTQRLKLLDPPLKH